MTDSENPKQPLSNWGVNSIRFTTFIAQQNMGGATELWDACIGQIPDNVNIDPRTSTTTIEGSYLKGKLTLVFMPGRIDWKYPIYEENMLIGDPLLTLGSFDEILPPFMKLLDKSISNTETLKSNRIALGFILLQKVESHKEGYQKLNTYLHNVEIDAEGSSEFMYRINRPRKAKLDPGISINRLSNWGVQKLLALSLVPEDNTYKEGKPSFAIRLELDINTIQDTGKVFNVEEIKKIYTEFIELGKEIAEYGDIK
jgi:hypothetical protein